MPDTSTQETLKLLEVDFQLPETKSALTEEEAIAWVKRVIADLLDKDFSRLLQICYRVDLNEQKLKHILHESDPEDIAMDLALALWSRQKQKVEIRRKYS
ncbi:hypothetical protein [Algoriphagus namhaensis]